MREALQSALAQNGLIIHGEVALPDDALWPQVNDRPAKAVVLIGYHGADFWPYFSTWLQKQKDAPTDPLDQWSKHVIADLAASFSADAYFPSDKPYLPFQRWAMEGLGIQQSPLGILMHPQYGLWHGFRGALAFEEWDIQHVPKLAHPCDYCAEKPCLKACPVGAFAHDGFDRVACREFLAVSEGQRCMLKGCAARNACPIGQDFRYDTQQLQFYLNAFERSK